MPTRERRRVGSVDRRVDVEVPEVHAPAHRRGPYRVVHPVERPEQGGLPRARGTDQRGDLALVDVEAHTADRVARQTTRSGRGGDMTGALVGGRAAPGRC